MTSNQPQNQKSDKKRPDIPWVAWLVVMPVLTVAMGLVAYFLTREVVTGRNIQVAFSSQYKFTPLIPTLTQVEETDQPIPTLSLDVELPAMVSAPDPEATLTPWDGKERVTILVMGVDYRDWLAGESAARSDTMMLITMDPVTGTAGLLSIPRDLWVAIPGFTHGKINTAHALGEWHDLPGGGPALAVRTVELVIGVPIHYYAVVDFGAFVRFIDELGGLKLDIPYKIIIDPLDGENVKLQPGVQTLSGDWALAYARNRTKGDGDFDRARRQQQVILGIRDRILEFELLPVLIRKAPTLYRELVSGVRTNLQLDEAIKLALMAQKIEDENIRQGVIDQKYVAFGWSPDNLSILIPYPDRIRVLRDEIFATSGILGPLTPGNEQERMYLEGATISILNASHDTELAARTAEYLTSQGAQVVEVRQDEFQLVKTKIIDHVGRPYTVDYLVDFLNVTDRWIYYEYDPDSAVDVEVLLGNDWVVDNNLENE